MIGFAVNCLSWGQSRPPRVPKTEPDRSAAMIQANVLVVDDEAINLEIVQGYLSSEAGFQVLAAEGGEQAWQLLQDASNRVDVILLDRMMPGLDGLALLKRIKSNARLSGIPVIMQTAAISPSQIREGLEAGAYYYLTKPYRPDDLLAIVHAALSDSAARDELKRQLDQHLDSLRLLNRAEFRIRTLTEAAQLAALVAQTCPCPDKVVMGLSELLINGIEHGNLGISYAEKTRLKREERWLEEIQHRLALPEHRHKVVQLDFQRFDDEIVVRVIDQGQGFDWERFLEMDPGRACDPNGRGIALARMLSFSSIEYEGKGNIVIARIACSATPALEAAA